MKSSLDINKVIFTVLSQIWVKGFKLHCFKNRITGYIHLWCMNELDIYWTWVNTTQMLGIFSEALERCHYKYALIILVTLNKQFCKIAHDNFKRYETELLFSNEHFLANYRHLLHRVIVFDIWPVSFVISSRV